ncbi:FlgB family protein [Pseudooceanicola sp. CBS1P-1]|uniref:FlgB family protein n=1 Tax=Pseudooceanicola albus TaxID=2692189 RepID=A0A6L7G746_9RHOB|nr:MULTISPECIES: FlgB family protein [Pseudooceanicola]MBT9385853.1 FlgB family protein [Pseudooceanicola endophyticus]MXN20084.1 FlgB family protein [Pseudooceanicola albus]
MFETLQIFRMSAAMARHASFRETVIAENVANADTPGFKARDTLSFTEALSGTGQQEGLRATRAKHLNGFDPRATLVSEEKDNPWTSPNGNSVSLEQQALKSIQSKQQHDRALAIYRSAMTLMRSAIGRR